MTSIAPDLIRSKAERFFLRDFKFVFGLYGSATLVLTILQIIFSKGDCTRYNAFIIFKQSFVHLLQNKNLYVLYLDEYCDLYKYSPTFAALMAPFYYLPDYVSLLLWNAVSVGLLFYAITSLPIADRLKIVILLFVFLEMCISTDSAQSNVLMAALLMLTFGQFERGNVLLAALFITCGIYIKIFALVGAAFFLLYDRKVQFIAYLILWNVVFLLLPLVVVSPVSLWQQYENWVLLLMTDHSTAYGLSVMGWLDSWFGIEWKDGIVVIGIVLFCLPYLKRAWYGDILFRLLFLASVLIWVVIFNHRAESQTFIIAMCGVGIWFFVQPASPVNVVLVVLAFVFTSLSMVFSADFHHRFMLPYTLKALFCIVIWVRIIQQMLTFPGKKEAIG